MIDGPSPLEIARDPNGWLAKSNEFYISGKILLEIRLENWDKWNKEHLGHLVTEKDKEVRQLINIKTPIVFNLAFSIELLVKAILVHQNPTKWIPDNGIIKFSHETHELIIKNIPIKLSDLEEKISKRIHEYVSFGKYPERRRPGDIIENYENLFNFHPYVNWSLYEYFEIISTLREKLKSFLFDCMEEKKPSFCRGG